MTNVEVLINNFVVSIIILIIMWEAMVVHMMRQKKLSVFKWGPKLIKKFTKKIFKLLSRNLNIILKAIIDLFTKAMKMLWSKITT